MFPPFLGLRKADAYSCTPLELYSSAYRMAWIQISPLQRREQPDIALPEEMRGCRANVRRFAQLQRIKNDIPLVAPSRRLRPR
jgi:hypothetical protein